MLTTCWSQCCPHGAGCFPTTDIPQQLLRAAEHFLTFHRTSSPSAQTRRLKGSFPAGPATTVPRWETLSSYGTQTMGLGTSSSNRGWGRENVEGNVRGNEFSQQKKGRQELLSCATGISIQSHRTETRTSCGTCCRKDGKSISYLISSKDGRP